MIYIRVNLVATGKRPPPEINGSIEFSKYVFYLVRSLLNVYFVVSDIVLNSWDILQVSKELGSALAETPNAEMKWDEFAMKLMGTNNKPIKSIKQSKSDYGDRCKALLEYWKTTTEEPRWDSIVAVLREVDLDGPAGILNRAITHLKQRNSRKRPPGEVGSVVGPAHQPISETSSDSEGIYIFWYNLQ